MGVSSPRVVAVELSGLQPAASPAPGGRRRHGCDLHLRRLRRLRPLGPCVGDAVEGAEGHRRAELDLFEVLDPLSAFEKAEAVGQNRVHSLLDGVAAPPDETHPR